MAISILKQNSLTFPWLLAQNKIPWLFPDFSLTIIFFPVFQTLWEPWCDKETLNSKKQTKTNMKSWPKV